MGKLITFAIVVLLAFAVWQGMNGIFAGSKLQGFMNDAAENARNNEVTQITQELVDRARQSQIPLQAEQVKVDISYGTKTDAAGTMTAQRGIVANQKRVVINVRHTYRILGLEMSSNLNAARTFPVSATMPTRDYVPTAP